MTLRLQRGSREKTAFLQWVKRTVKHMVLCRCPTFFCNSVSTVLYVHMGTSVPILSVMAWSQLQLSSAVLEQSQLISVESPKSRDPLAWTK